MRSVGQGNCVEVGYAPNAIGLRDTKNRAGGMLAVPPASFHTFLRAIKDGRLS